MLFFRSSIHLVIVFAVAASLPAAHSADKCASTATWADADKCGRSWQETHESQVFCRNFALAYFLPSEECDLKGWSECVRAHRLLSTTRLLYNLRLSDVIIEWSAVITATVRLVFKGRRWFYLNFCIALLGMVDFVMQVTFVAISFGCEDSYKFLEAAQEAACTNIDGVLAMEEILSHFKDLRYLGCIEMFIVALGLFLDAFISSGEETWKLVFVQVSLLVLNSALTTVAFFSLATDAQDGVEELYGTMMQTDFVGGNGQDGVGGTVAWCVKIHPGAECNPSGIPPRVAASWVSFLTIIGLMAMFIVAAVIMFGRRIRKQRTASRTATMATSQSASTQQSLPGLSQEGAETSSKHSMALTASTTASSNSGQLEFKVQATQQISAAGSNKSLGQQSTQKSSKRPLFSVPALPSTPFAIPLHYAAPPKSPDCEFASEPSQLHSSPHGGTTV